ncbi:MAG: Peptidase family protein [Bacteroidetes bacterium]|nr:Peptidase family protein [Bacteroidota bacterium]
MKKKVLLLLSGVCLLTCQMMAATVSVQTAKTVATNFYKGVAPAAGIVTPTLLYTRTEADNTVDFYVFDMAPLKGFVIVSADDILKPIMAYSTEANFDLNYGNTGIKDWMGDAAAHVYSTIQQHMQANTAITQMWTACKTGPYINPSRTGTIGPLIHTLWDQSPNYNALCPFNATDNQRTVTGCVATTMAQIMKYWSYPTRGTGSYSYDCYSSSNYHYGTQSANFNHVYDWANMPNILAGANADVAQLMYDCGVSVAMSYGDNNEGGSGAFVLASESWASGVSAETSFKDYFYYDPSTLQGVRTSDYTSAQWTAMMKAEIDAGRVVQYEGADPTEGGHTWVMDGYDANNMMHMNWGWSGSYNGYFTASSLNAGGANFTSREGALIGIKPLFPYAVSIQTTSAQVCIGNATQLSAQGPASGTYTWVPATGLDCATCAVTNAHPTATTLYTVTCDSAGVRVPSTILVTVVPAVTADFTVANTQACSAPAAFAFVNNSKFASDYIWDFGDGDTTGSTQMSPHHVYHNYGVYDVTLTSTGNCGTDTKNLSQYVAVNNTAPVAPAQAVCSGSSATLSAVAAGDITWYTSATGGSALATSASYSTPSVSATTTYYAEAQILGPIVMAGMQDNTVGTGSYYTGNSVHGVTFSCYTPQILSYVDVYAQNTGTATIILTNSQGTTLQSAQIWLDAGLNTVALNFNIPVGNNMQLASSGNPVQMFRNRTGINYPYYSQDSSVILTTSDQGLGYYYFFYNWQLQSAQCVSARVPVVVYVLNGTNSFSYTATTGNNVTFAPAVNVSGATYTWSFGDGTTSTDQNPAHQYSGSGNYTVTLTVSNGSCSDQVSGVISAAAGATAIRDLDVVQSISTYPNPVKDQLDIKVNAIQATTVTMAIYDVIGNVVSTKDVQVNIGANIMTEDVSSYASGVYTIAMYNGSSKATSRFVKE